MAGKTVDAKGTGARYAKVEKVEKQGKTICVSTLKGIYTMNRKTGKTKRIASKKHITKMLIHKGYLYYSLYEKDYENTYRVKLSGGKSELFIEGASVDFIKNGRFYYFKEGICSIKPNGKDEKRHLSYQYGG